MKKNLIIILTLFFTLFANSNSSANERNYYQELINNWFDKHRENHALGDVVTTNNYLIEILELQIQGKRVMNNIEFSNGYKYFQIKIEMLQVLNFLAIS